MGRKIIMISTKFGVLGNQSDSLNKSQSIRCLVIGQIKKKNVLGHATTVSTKNPIANLSSPVSHFVPALYFSEAIERILRTKAGSFESWSVLFIFVNRVKLRSLFVVIFFFHCYSVVDVCFKFVNFIY